MIQECVQPEEFFKKKHFIFFDYICHTEDARVKLDERELQEYKWFRIDEINEDHLESYTRNMISKFREDQDINNKRIYTIKK